MKGRTVLAILTAVAVIIVNLWGNRIVKQYTPKTQRALISAAADISALCIMSQSSKNDFKNSSCVPSYSASAKNSLPYWLPQL